MSDQAKYEAIVLAKALEIFHRRSQMNYAAVAAWLRMGKTTYYRLRAAQPQQRTIIGERIYERLAAWNLETDAAFTPRPLALPFPADPHGEHAEEDSRT